MLDSLMRDALTLAQRGCGFVEPNPLVGAIVLDAAGQVVGRGFHQRFGEAHAEVNALADAGERARGGTLIVTLEPCCHTGKTPPCTEAILAAGIVRVVAAMSDPFPQVSGRGIKSLRTAGIEVLVGVCESDARRLNAPFIKLHKTGRPYVHAKWAMTLDGRVATRTGSSKWITNEESRRVVHELRGRMDAVIVGRGTVLADDPRLTARPPGPRVAARVVVSRSGGLPGDCQLLRSPEPVIVYTEHPERVKGWPEVVFAATIEDVLKDLGHRRFTNVLVEGGPTLLGSFLDATAIDEVHVFMGPKLFNSGRPVSEGVGIDTVGTAMEVQVLETRTCGSDVYVRGIC